MLIAAATRGALVPCTAAVAARGLPPLLAIGSVVKPKLVGTVSTNGTLALSRLLAILAVCTAEDAVIRGLMLMLPPAGGVEFLKIVGTAYRSSLSWFAFINWSSVKWKAQRRRWQPRSFADNLNRSSCPQFSTHCCDLQQTTY